MKQFRNNKAKIFVVLINTTIKGYGIAVGRYGGVTEKERHSIISGLVAQLEAFNPVTKEILEYCKEHYGYKN